MLLQTILYSLLLTNFVLSIPPNDKALFDNDDPETRGHKRRRRPCRGRSPDGRTFFDWNLHYVDVNYNYNYNVNCGGGGGGPYGGGGGGGPQKPILSGVGAGGGGGGPQKPILSGLLQGVGNAVSGDDAGGGGGSLLGSGINFVQSQVQNFLDNPPNLPNLGSYLPQAQDSASNGGGFGGLFNGGLFNGQGVLSLFENGLFSGIFDNNRPAPGSVRPPNVPSRPPPSVPNRPPPIVTVKPDTPDPDDIIYNDEKPVNEPHDDVLPDQYNRPGQYIVASNPVFGTFVHEVNGYNHNRIVRQFNREVNWLTKSFASLFGI